MSEIAGYDDAQMRWVVFRERDKSGKLKRDTGLPDWVEVDERGMRVVSEPKSFGQMYAQVQESRGLEREEIRRKWKQYTERHPKLKQEE